MAILATEKENNKMSFPWQSPTASGAKPSTTPEVNGEGNANTGNKVNYGSAMETLGQMENSAPSFTSDYDGQISELYDKIVNRDPFSYNYSTDPLYGQYKESYTQQGQQAMRDTMGQAAALTGGYASSYGQAVGQQTYDTYLQRLNDVLPELYGAAYDIYTAEGDKLTEELGLANALRESEYQKYRDTVGDQQYEEAKKMQEAELRASYGDFGGIAELYGQEAASKAQAMYNLQTLAPYIESGLYLYPGMESLLAPLMGSAGISMSGLLGSGSNNDVWGYGGSGYNPGYQLEIDGLAPDVWKDREEQLKALG